MLYYNKQVKFSKEMSYHVIYMDWIYNVNYMVASKQTYLSYKIITISHMFNLYSKYFIKYTGNSIIRFSFKHYFML